MALVLAMQANRSFFVDDTEVKITEVRSTFAKVKVIGKMDQIFTLSESQRTELMPDVYAQLGISTGGNTIKIAIEAPKHRRILRDSLYYANPAA